MRYLEDDKTVLEPAVVAKFCAESDWTFESGKLVQEFKFSDFSAAFAFMTRCALTFEAYNHHASWSNVFSRVRIKLWTHIAGGVTARDVQVASRLDAQFGGGAVREAA